MKRVALTPSAVQTWNFHHYLPITDRLLRSGTYLIGAGRARIRPGETYPPIDHPRLYNFDWHEGRTLPAFSVVFITGGRGIFETEKTGKSVVESNSVITLFPGIWHRYRPDLHTGWTEKWIHFNGDFIHQLMDESVFSPHRPILRPEHFGNAETAMDRLLDATHCEPSFNSHFFSLLVLAVLAAIGEPRADEVPQVVSHTTAGVQDPVVAAALHFIWTASHRTISVLDVARSAGVTRRMLERHMKDSRGHGVLQEIVQCRFSRAEWLLRETDLPIKTVVHLSGFGSVQNMRYVFLDRTKCAPGLYRSQTRAHAEAPEHSAELHSALSQAEASKPSRS